MQIFYTNLRDLEWSSYLENFCLGMRIYFLKEDVNDLPAARIHHRR